MTTVETRRTTATAGNAPEPLSSRARRGVPLMVGGLAVLFLLEPLGFLPQRGGVPLLIGLSYVVAGLLSGKRGQLLGPGLVIAGWGLAPLTVNSGHDFPGMFYVCMGTGMLIAALLAQRGWFRITPMSLALPVLFIGGVMYLAQYAHDALTAALAVLLVGWGAWQLRPQRADAASPAPAA